MARKKDAVSQVAPPQRPVLSRIEVLALIVLFVLGVLFAVPAMKDTHIGACPRRQMRARSEARALHAPA
jgi:hypothetical protein